MRIGGVMGRLHEAVQEIERICADRGLDAITIKGEISMKSGFFLAIIFPHTPDDNERLDKLRTAAHSVLGASLIS